MSLRAALLAVTTIVAAVSLRADCGVERWAIKTATDSEAQLIDPVPVVTTIAMLRSLPAPRPLPNDRRVGSAELTQYSLNATLTSYSIEDDGDYHLVIADESGRTMIAEIPSSACVSGSRFAAQIIFARRVFESRLTASPFFRRTKIPIVIQGVGFFDELHNQRGVAPNGIELHPVTQLSMPPPPPPKWSGYHPPTCTMPTLSMSVSPPTVCSGQPTTLTWNASDANASVNIDGVGSALPASGSRTLGSTQTISYAGRATNFCGTGPDSVVTLAVQTNTATATLSGPSTLQRGSTGSLFFSVAGSTFWSFTSSLRNSIFPSSGTTNGGFNAAYSATNSGVDTVTLTANGGSCGSVVRTININVTAPTPQPNQGLQCCDGTRSPTCFNCASKQGCCSSHGGVCGCPN
jgi:hypothetical protein